ncbi:MAG: minor capsid protein [Cyclobacteriaceae bacterium]|nr:minor capsid protein [Cyclobacteriaceae bacterium]
MNELHQQLSDLHVSCCEHKAVLPNLIDQSIIDQLLLNIFNAGGLLQSPEMKAAIFNDLWKGVKIGIGADFDTLDEDFIQALRGNVSQFSDAKNYTMLRELNAALIKADGTLATFSEFQEAARKITDIYLKNYLKAEYNLAVTGGQMAAKWKQIIANKDALPLLQFDAIIDTQTTEICRPLDGVTLPVDHPFWNRFYPPNHYGCRSTVRQLAQGTVTANDKIPSADIPDMFKTNLGANSLIFPTGHPYFIR